jgi:hypothetical protein
MCLWHIGGAACKPQPLFSLLRGKRENANDPAYLHQNHLISFEIEWFFFLHIPAVTENL